MPGYLIWLNARLVEMKRLLKKSGTLCVHLDWHATHYVKGELDKIFGYDNFVNEVIWHYKSFHGNVKQYFARKHDSLLLYGKSSERTFNRQFDEDNEDTIDFKRWTSYLVDGRYILGGNMPTQDSRFLRFLRKWKRINGREPGEADIVYEVTGQAYDSVWDIKPVDPKDGQRIGYPTQKPEELLRRLILSTTNKGDVVADFFNGGGTTAAAALQCGRNWIGCDQSRVAIAITADRISKIAEQPKLGDKVPDFTVEHWGIYEKDRLAQTPPEGFREFVLRAYGAVPDPTEAGIHGRKGAIPIWVGEPSMRSQVTAEHVVAFANAIKKSLRYQQDNLRDGIMLAWSFRSDALQAASELRDREQTSLDFVKLDHIRIDSPQFREHITALTTDHADYENFLTFVQPPKVELGFKKLQGRTFVFDVSETALMNSGARIINVQWDFDYQRRFTSTHGYSFVRGANGAPAMQAQYTFDAPGKKRIAVKVQDDLGGEGMKLEEIQVD